MADDDVNIELAGPPEALSGGDGEGLRIKVPLTAPPDERLLDAIEQSPPITAFCGSIDTDEHALVLLLKSATEPEALSTLLNAVSSLVDRANAEREDLAKTDEQRRLEELEAQRADAEAELRVWWERRG